MTKASVRDLRRRVIARSIPESGESPTKLPDFLERLRAIYGDKILSRTGADLIAEDRSRF